jgi:ADP-ribose pyrophosphatase YjhB (NUDIX family)
VSRPHGSLDDPGSRVAGEDLEAGAPRWLAQSLRFCPRCGSAIAHGRVDHEDRERHHCTACGFVAYLNPRLVVSTLPVTEDGELVLLRRGVAPGIGDWAQPGGYLEADETAIQGAMRETVEETGLLVEPTRIVGIYSRIPAAVVVIAYEARITGGQMTTTPESLEVRSWSPDEIPWPELAFNTTLWAIRDWVGSVRPDLDVAALGSEHPAR